MVAVVLLTIGVLVVLDAIFLILHAADPNSYGPAGGLQNFRGFSLAFIQTFGIAAVLVGAAAGSTDLSDGVFRHLVATGRSRLALFVAKVPAGLMLIIPITAIAYAIEAIVAAYFAPSGTVQTITGIPAAIHHGGGTIVVPNVVTQSATPSIHLLVIVGLWLMLQVVVAFVIGLGLGALTGSRIRDDRDPHSHAADRHAASERRDDPAPDQPPASVRRCRACAARALGLGQHRWWRRWRRRRKPVVDRPHARIRSCRRDHRVGRGMARARSVAFCHTRRMISC